MLRALTIAMVAVGFANAAFAVDGARPRHAARPIPGSASSWRSQDIAQDTASTVWRAAAWEQKAWEQKTWKQKTWKQKPDRTLAADRDPYADPAAPYQANRVSSPLASQSILDTPGQVTVLTRQVLDDKNATSLKDALSTTAGVTVGR
jgi:outer membrane receptor for monomeric catechols